MSTDENPFESHLGGGYACAMVVDGRAGAYTTCRLKPGAALPPWLTTAGPTASTPGTGSTASPPPAPKAGTAKPDQAVIVAAINAALQSAAFRLDSECVEHGFAAGGYPLAVTPAMTSTSFGTQSRKKQYYTAISRSLLTARPVALSSKVPNVSTWRDVVLPKIAARFDSHGDKEDRVAYEHLVDILALVYNGSYNMSDPDLDSKIADWEKGLAADARAISLRTYNVFNWCIADALSDLNSHTLKAFAGGSDANYGQLVHDMAQSVAVAPGLIAQSDVDEFWAVLVALFSNELPSLNTTIGGAWRADPSYKSTEIGPGQYTWDTYTGRAPFGTIEFYHPLAMLLEVTVARLAATYAAEGAQETLRLHTGGPLSGLKAQRAIKRFEAAKIQPVSQSWTVTVNKVRKADD